MSVKHKESGIHLLPDQRSWKESSAADDKLSREKIQNVSVGRKYIPVGNMWSEKEVAFIKANHEKMSFKELGDILGRSESSIRNKLIKTGTINPTKTHKYWSKEEKEFLEENYSKKGVDYVAKKLNRSVESVRHKAMSMRIYAKETDALTLRTIADSFQSDVSVVKRWISKFDMPHEILSYTKKRQTNRVYRVDSEKFWAWAEKHKDVINWSKYDIGSIIPEPTWAVYAKIESKSPVNSRKSFKTSEIKKIRELKARGVPIREIAEMYGRSIESIKHICRTSCE